MDFLPDLATLAKYSLAVVLLNYTPGPDMAMFVGSTIARGRKAGLAAFAGTNCGILVHTLLVAFGLSALLAASVMAFTALKIIGVFYLLYLAYGALRHGGQFSVDGGEAGAEPLRRLYLKALGVNVLNPKVALFFLTFLPQFVEAADPHAQGKFLFLGLWFLVVSVPATLPLILGAEGLAGFLKRKPGVIRLIDYCFAGVMAAFALKLLLARAK
ncbi:LysE family translocator [Oryzibacter oryziterrae]|uniref:LysE family translocator n=1 Tax=Oryzibacter oryziterrae TaxID=2766474 RepID=UPI001F4500C6|nr:LysE family translocator [Oryzibacter oryziterrae]